MGIVKTLIVTLIAGVAMASVASASSIYQPASTNSHSLTHQMVNLVKANSQAIDTQAK